MPHHVSYFTNTRPVEAEFFHADGRTDMTKTLKNALIAHKKEAYYKITVSINVYLMIFIN